MIVAAPAAAPAPKSPGLANTARARRAAEAERQRAALGDRVPKHVQHCYHCGARDWWIYTWQKLRPETVIRVPYQCQSWRCTECRKQDARVNYARFQQAAAPLDPLGWCFLTLTVPRAGFVGWDTVDTAYKSLSAMSRNFMARLRRWMVGQGWCDEVERVSRKGKRTVVKKARWSNQWIGVVEAHRSGWPHMHFTLWSPELAEWLREHPQQENLLAPALEDAALATGWGVRSTLEPARSRDKVASYLLKLSGEAGALIGEIAKMTQLPTNAPIKFRRVRAGKNFLPPRRKNEAYTGTLLRGRPDQYGIAVAPIHRVQNCPIVAHLCAQEETLMLHAHHTATPHKPVSTFLLPRDVVEEYDAPRQQSAEPDSSRDGAALGGRPVAAAGPSAPQRREAIEACDSRESQRNRELRRLRLGGVSSVNPTCPSATINPTGWYALRRSLAKSNEEPPRPPIWQMGSAMQSAAPPLSWAEGGSYELRGNETKNRERERPKAARGTAGAPQGFNGTCAGAKAGAAGIRPQGVGLVWAEPGAHCSAGEASARGAPESRPRRDSRSPGSQQGRLCEAQGESETLGRT